MEINEIKYPEKCSYNAFGGVEGWVRSRTDRSVEVFVNTGLFAVKQKDKCIGRLLGRTGFGKIRSDAVYCYGGGTEKTAGHIARYRKRGRLSVGSQTTLVAPASSSFFFMASNCLMSDTVDLHLYTTRLR